jgi:ubiquinone/menaquinone biosynthesis C-methylase UbiE
MYERYLVGPLFRPFAEVLVARAQLGEGDRVLDVACGTGIVARLAKDCVGRGLVVGVDVSSQMLDVARLAAPAIEWREGNAGALPLKPDESFESVFCHQGLQFFPDKAAALREMKGAIAAGGRLVVGVWKPLEDSPFFRESYVVAERRLGSFVDRRHSFGDATVLERLISTAGFQRVGVESLTLPIRFTDPAMFVRMNAMALVGMGAPPGTSDEERRQLVDVLVDEATDVVGQYSDAGGLAFELGANVGVARAPVS